MAFGYRARHFPQHNKFMHAVNRALARMSEDSATLGEGGREWNCKSTDQHFENHVDFLYYIWCFDTPCVCCCIRFFTLHEFSTFFLCTQTFKLRFLHFLVFFLHLIYIIQYTAGKFFTFSASALYLVVFGSLSLHTENLVVYILNNFIVLLTFFSVVWSQALCI